MKFSSTIIVLFTLLFSSVSFSQTKDSTWTDETFVGLILSKNEKSILISVGDKITVKTSTYKCRGVLDSLADGKIYMDNKTILAENIDNIKYATSDRKKAGKGFLISAPISLVTGLGFGF
ncbi:MAG: hypothetical protein P8I55_14265 [Crocinitomix sp.]|nr:hypothetical protein [Crocinitomix sp.]